MANSTGLDYGRCPCGGQYENRTVEVRMTVGDRPIVLPDVPQGACPVCGSRVYKTGVLERIEALFKAQATGRTLNQPEG